MNNGIESVLCGKTCGRKRHDHNKRILEGNSSALQNYCLVEEGAMHKSRSNLRKLSYRSKELTSSLLYASTRMSSIEVVEDISLPI